MTTHVAPAVASEEARAAPSPLLWGLGLGGLLASAASTWLLWRSPLISDPEATGVLKGLTVACYVGVGAYTWWRRPDSRLGQLVAGAGFIFGLTSLTGVDEPVAFTVGRVALAAQVVYFTFLFACFPRERLSTAFERRFVLAVGGLSAVAWAIVLVFANTLPHGGPATDCADRCPGNPFQLVSTSDATTKAIGGVTTGLTALAVTVAIGLLAHKARAPARLRRRAVAPLLYASILLAGSYGTYTVLGNAGSGTPHLALTILVAVAACAIPLAVLVGQLRGRLFAASTLWTAIERAVGQDVTPRWLQGFLTRTLGDPTLQLAVWEPARRGWADVDGEPLELPVDSSDRSVTTIDRAGRSSLALIHDRALDDERDIVRGLGSTADMLLENAALVAELQASRARIVDSAERERLRLERDLHDGAQQRLMAIQIKLALAREQTADGELDSRLEELAADAAAAVDELRSLAHGIYPTVLHERGLADALRSYATRAPIRVDVVDRGAGRASAVVEAAIYYCVLEALQNAVKHAGPKAQVSVTLTNGDGRIDFDVRDDGVGFDAGRPSDVGGIGIVSMRDRIGALGGTVEIRSALGEGTTVSGSVPVAAAS